MANITLTPMGEACQVEANDDAGVDFVDSWVPVLYVVDSGIIHIAADQQLALEKDAKAQGLTCDIEEGA